MNFWIASAAIAFFFCINIYYYRSENKELAEKSNFWKKSFNECMRKKNKLEKENSRLEGDLDTLKNQYDNLRRQYDELKSSNLDRYTKKELFKEILDRGEMSDKTKVLFIGGSMHLKTREFSVIMKTKFMPVAENETQAYRYQQRYIEHKVYDIYVYEGLDLRKTKDQNYINESIRTWRDK